MYLGRPTYLHSTPQCYIYASVDCARPNGYKYQWSGINKLVITGSSLKANLDSRKLKDRLFVGFGAASNGNRSFFVYLNYTNSRTSEQYICLSLSLLHASLVDGGSLVHGQWYR